MPKGSTAQTDVLAALLSGTDPTYRLGNNLYIALHTGSPAGGDQTLNEVTTTAYIGYVRYTLAKSGAWTPAGSTYSNTSTITFATCAGGTSPIATYYSIGVGSATPAVASQSSESSASSQSSPFILKPGPPVDYPQPEGDMEIYDAFRWPDSIPNKPFAELTKEQKQLVMDAYRFSGFRPGTYQGVTWAGNGILPF